MTIDIDGNWRKGMAFDVHTLSSTYLGQNETGHDQYENVRSEMGELVYKLKYRQDKTTLPAIVTLLDKMTGIEQFTYIIPIPPTDRTRAFQPVTEIALALGHRRGVKVLTDFLGKRVGGQQIKNINDPLEREKRLLETLYIEAKYSIAGSYVLLIDDLYRSGVTLRIATELLKQAGASDVCALTMTATVFLSGSRTIVRLSDVIRQRLKKMIDQDFRIVVGDANGADKALQTYLAEAHYDNVVVFCAGYTCRNNVGSWNTNNVEVDSKLKGRDFYTQKDKAMATQADYGFVLWDGKSAGSLNNILELMKNGKPVVVYFGPEKSCVTLKEANDLKSLLQRCDGDDYRDMNDKIHVDRQLKDLYPSTQGALSL